jgi:serine/threonine protein phosphatase 1
MESWVIADIHGCLQTFQKLVEDKIGLSENNILYLLGDMIDRGPRSKETLDYIMSLQQQGYSILPVRGNHEEFIIRSYNKKSKTIAIGSYLCTYPKWKQSGGNETLTSFQVETINDIPYPYIQWMESLPYYHRLENFIIVHAGLNCTLSNPFADTSYMVIGKQMEIIPQAIHYQTIIHGHTILSREEINQTLTNRNKNYHICLDNGCIYADRKGFGSLVALNLNRMTLESQKNID